MDWNIWDNGADFGDLQGLTLTKVVASSRNEEVHFFAESGEEFVLMHFQDCCESVGLEKVIGNLEDIIGIPVLFAENVSESYPNNDYQNDDGIYEEHYFKVGTAKGNVVFKWTGDSNGYYSVGVDFIKVPNA